VLATLTELMVRRGVPEYIRSDNGPEFTAKRVKDWIKRIGAKTLFIEPSSPWENGYNESFNGKLSNYPKTCRVISWSSKLGNPNVASNKEAAHGQER
jgi:transposase InsO family protein